MTPTNVSAIFGFFHCKLGSPPHSGHSLGVRYEKFHVADKIMVATALVLLVQRQDSHQAV